MIAMRTQVEHVRLRYDTAVAASPQRAITVLAGPTSLASPPVGRAGVVRVWIRLCIDWIYDLYYIWALWNT